jgi:hypothetical protein
MIRSAGSRAGRPGRAVKAAELVRLAMANPIELFDRLRARVEVKGRERRPTPASYNPVTWNALTMQLQHVVGDGHAVDTLADEFEMVYDDVATRARAMPAVPFPAMFDADPVLARVAYVFARAFQPEIVVETGVALGVVSACVLAALERNGRGRLLSVDLPPLGTRVDAVGCVVPDTLRPRWTLHRGTSTRLLPAIVKQVPPVGLFIQDSLFTWRNSTLEYRQVLPHLAPRSAIIANCVQHSQAFVQLVGQSQPSVSAVVEAEHKPGELIGVWARKAA